MPSTVANLVLSEHSSVMARVSGSIFLRQEASLLVEKNVADSSWSGKLTQLPFESLYWSVFRRGYIGIAEMMLGFGETVHSLLVNWLAEGVMVKGADSSV